MKNPDYIPFHLPTIGPEEIDEVVDTLKSGWLTTGEKTLRFEENFKRYVQAPHALAVNSCTAALHLALVALGIGPGDEVITTPLTFCATVNTILHTGATPVLADIGADGNIDPDAIAARITPRTRCLIPVHLAGLPCDMERIWEMARRANLFVVEDAAHACGARIGEFPVGASEQKPCSDAVAFSFYATKNITTGEGGMITTPHAGIAARLRSLALHGISRDAWQRYSEKGNWYYEVLEPGFKYNLSDLQSAIGIHQLAKADEFVQARAAIAKRYTESFADMPELETPPDATSGRHAWHLYALRLNERELNIDRAEFIRELRAEGIGTSVHFIPIPLHPFFERWADVNPCPKAIALYRRLVSLPLYPKLTDAEIDRVIASVKRVVSKHTRTLVAVAG